MPAREFQTARGYTSPFGSLLGHMLPYWRRLAFVVALSVVGTFVALVLPYLTKGLVDEAILGRDAGSLLRFVLLFAGLTVVGFVLNVASGLLYTRVSADILFEMRLRVFRHLQRLSPRFYASTRLGDIVSRLNNDISEVQRIAAETALALVGNVLFLVGTLAAMIWLSATLFAVGAAVWPLSVWLLVRYRRTLEARVASLRARSAEVGSFLIEALQGMRLAVTSNAGERECRRFRDKNDAFVTALMAMQRATYLAGGLPGVILALGTALVFIVGGLRVIEGSMTLGTLVAFMAYQARLIGPVQGLMGLYTNLASMRVSLARVQSLLDVPPEVVEAQDAVRLAGARGDVEFERVTLWFDRGAPVLDEVSFAVRAGERLAIVGSSGAGKSTIADLMLRLLEPDSGVIRLDGCDLRRISLHDVHRHVALVDQTPFVLHASILENLRYVRPDATPARVAGALQAAGLEELLARLADGDQTVVGERGAALSAGERQRLAIARAFLIEPTVLILDEATASLDPATERQVIDQLEALMRGRTTIIITHRHDLVARADRVLVLDGARIVQHGTPAELGARPGAYNRIFDAGEGQWASPSPLSTAE